MMTPSQQLIADRFDTLLYSRPRLQMKVVNGLGGGYKYICRRMEGLE